MPPVGRLFCLLAIIVGFCYDSVCDYETFRHFVGGVDAFVFLFRPVKKQFGTLFYGGIFYIEYPDDIPDIYGVIIPYVQIHPVPPLSFRR